MFVDKIGNGLSKHIGFKGYSHEVDDYGTKGLRLNYPYDPERQDVYVRFFRTKRSAKHYCGYEIPNKERPFARIKIDPKGTFIDLKNIVDAETGENFSVDDDETIAYQIEVVNKADKHIIKQGADTGISVELGGFTLLSTRGTTPVTSGFGYLGMMDSILPGIKRHGFNSETPGKIYFDKQAEERAENAQRTFSNKMGGTLAGIETLVPELKKSGVKIFFGTPIANGDNRSSHRYWNKNNMQVASDLGGIQDFDSLMKNLFLNGMKFVFDGTFTSEGLEGIHLQYALKWADYKPDELYMFNLESLKDSPMTMGIVPFNKENFRIRLVNAPYIFEQASNGKISKKANPNYDSKKPTYIQAYDKRYITPEQLSKDEPIDTYEKLETEDKLAVNSYQDTTVSYLFEVHDWKEIETNIKKIEEQNLKLDSPEGSIALAEMSHIRVGLSTEGAVTWDANNDMVKMRHEVSPYDEKILMAIPEESVRAAERKRYQTGVCQSIDMAMQAGRYWTERVKDVINLTIAQKLKGAKTYEEIKTLVDAGKLPEDVLRLTPQAIQNIIDGNRTDLSPIGELEKDDITIRALMKLPLDALEVAENTQGVLSSTYFTNRASEEEQIGMTRFQLEQAENPQLDAEHAGVYRRINSLFRNEIKSFAHEIIKEIDKKSDEKLLDTDGNYTEYGEYVINLIGEEIAKYALLKALSGKSFKSKTLEDGSIIYDYDSIRENTHLQSLGINGHSPKDEASQLEFAISRGLSKLNIDDVNTLAQAFGKQLEGTTTEGFRLAEVMYKVSGLGLDWRLDAAKDVMDMDSIRNGDVSFDEGWARLFSFWRKFNEIVKEQNPASSIMAEMTDLDKLMRANYGEEFNYGYSEEDLKGVNDGGYQRLASVNARFKNVMDALMQFMIETGTTSEAAYSEWFSLMTQLYAKEFTNGETTADAGALRKALVDLLSHGSVDFINNLYSFVGNQDKPRLIQDIAINMSKFYTNLSPFNKYGHYRREEGRGDRLDALQIVAGVDRYEDLPLEFKLNADNIDYMRTLSSRAYAMSRLLKDSMEGVNISPETRQYILRALGELTEGRYLQYGPKSRQVINIPELSNMDNAINAVIPASIPGEERQHIKEWLLSHVENYIPEHMVTGDFGWSENLDKVKKLLNDGTITAKDAEKYSLYTVCLASTIREAVENDTRIAQEVKEQIYKEIENFVRKYDAKALQECTKNLPTVESAQDAMRKNGYAAKDIQYDVLMLIEEAEYLARKEGKLAEDEHFTGSDDIMLNIYKNAIEPAVQKSLLIMSALSALPGRPVIYHGDELGMSGGEEKAKNVYLQNRNTLKMLELHEGIFKDFRQRIADLMERAMLIRSRVGIDPLNYGTPYMLNTADDRIVTYLMQDSKGNTVIPIINLSGINHDARADYSGSVAKDSETSINPDNKYVPVNDDVTLDYIELPEGIALPEGTELRNTDTSDQETYKVVLEDGKYRIRRQSVYGDKIVMNQSTAKNGVLILTTMVAALAAATGMYKKGIQPKQIGKYLGGYLHKVG